MSRLQALPLATHARTHRPILDRQPFCGSPPVVPPTGGDNGAVMERGRTRAGSVRRTHDDAGFQALANSPTTLRRSGRAIRLLRKHIWQRARFNYRFKVTRLCCSFFCPLAWALSYDIGSDIFFRFPKCYFRGSILHPGYEKYNDSNTERELCSTFVREPVCIKACAMNGRRSLFFVPIQVQHASVA